MEGSTIRNMKKLKVISAVLCTAMLLVQTACGQTGSNAIVAKVNDTNIYRWELDNYYKAQLPIMNEQNDINLEESKHSQDRHQYRMNLLQDLINQRAVIDYGKANGYDLTEEEKQEVQTELDEAKKAKINQFIEEDFSGDAQAEKKAEEKWEASLKENHYTEESLYQDMYDHRVHEKVGTEIYDETEVDDEALQKEYDTLVNAQKIEYTANPTLYLEAAQVPSGRVLYNLPESIRIKYINIDIPEDIDEEIKKIDDQVQQIMVEQAIIGEQKGKDSKAFKDSRAKETELTAQTQELYKKAYDQIRPKAEEALKKAKAGENFDQLMKEYGEDPIFEELGIRDIGYLIGPDTSDVTMDVKEQALKLQNEGDVSELVQSEIGFTIIQLVSKVPDGPIAMNDDIREYLTQQIKINPLYLSINNINEEARAEATVEIMENQV